MYVHHGLRRIYLAAPRTASRATARALANIGFELAAGVHHHCPDAKDLPDGYSVATTVRDHITAVESWWWKMHKRKKHMPHLVDKGRAMEVFASHPGYFWFTSNVMWPFRLRAKADTILRFEHIHADLEKWLKRSIDMRPVGVLAGQRPEVTRECADWLREKFADERAELGY